jgi:predicted nucleic-acid-binding Zn-ribbon protein
MAEEVKLKGFNTKAVCTKCGSDEIDCMHVSLDQAKVNSITTCSLDIEHMIRNCSNCGYTWNEAPLDTSRL